MSSNVGLSTPRGSGTSGYVQRNLSYLKPRQNSAPYPSPSDPELLQKHRARQPDKSILLHERKRDVEVKCLELQDKLEEEGKFDEDEIEQQVDSLRKKLLEELERGGGAGADGGLRKGGKGLKSHQVHELAEAKEREMKRMEKALGISPDYEEGSHWQKQAQRKLDRELGGGGSGGGGSEGRRDRDKERD